MAPGPRLEGRKVPASVADHRHSEALKSLNRRFCSWVLRKAPRDLYCYGGELEWFFDDTQIEVTGKHFEAASMNYNGDIAEKQPPYPTLRYPFLARTYDHVASNFLTGVCQVLGESPGTERLDGGRGCDHRAVYGILS